MNFCQPKKKLFEIEFNSLEQLFYLQINFSAVYLHFYLKVYLAYSTILVSRIIVSLILPG